MLCNKDKVDTDMQFSYHEAFAIFQCLQQILNSCVLLMYRYPSLLILSLHNVPISGINFFFSKVESGHRMTLGAISALAK